MAGNLVRVMPTRTHDFSGVFGGSFVDLVVKSRINVTSWRTAALVVKVVSGDFGGGSITVAAQLEGPTGEDPGAIFVAPTLLGSVVLDSTNTAPYTLVAPLGVALGPTIRVIVRGFHAMTGGNVLGTFSVDACLRNG